MAKSKTAVLTDKQLAFVAAYLRCFNATDAAKSAGYSKATAQEQGSRLLSNVMVRALIDKELDEKMMGATEVLVRLSDIARGDIAQLMEVSTMGFNLDMAKAKDAGLTKLIKRVKQKTTLYSAKGESGEDREETVTEIELYDAQSALVTIGKERGLFTTKVEIKDWREEARKAGYDPEKLYKEFLAAAQRGTAAVDAGSDGRGDTGSEADPTAPGAGDG